MGNICDNRNTKRCSVSLMISKVEIKTTVREVLTSISLAKLRSLVIPNVGK
jgi:hypothetical protein